MLIDDGLRPAALMIGLLLAGGITASSRAELIEIGVFAGDAEESFTDIRRGFHHEPLNVFGGLGTVEGGTLNVARSWSFYDVVNSVDDDHHFAGSTGHPVSFLFENGVYGFGGWFATNANVEGGLASFYGLDDEFLGELDFDVSADGQWSWAGWSSGIAIGRVDLRSGYGGGGLLMQDNMQIAVQTIPAPSALALVGGAMLIGNRRRSGQRLK